MITRPTATAPSSTFYLIDPNNNKVPCYYLHQRFINNGRLLTAQFQERNGRLPTDSEFVSMVSPTLDQPLPAPVNLGLANLGSTLLSNATVSGFGQSGARCLRR